MCTGAKWPLLLTLPSPGAGLGCGKLLPHRVTPLQGQDHLPLEIPRISGAVLPASPRMYPQSRYSLGVNRLCPRLPSAPRRPVSSRTKVRRDIHVSTPRLVDLPSPTAAGRCPHTCWGQWNPALGPVLMARVTGPAANLWKFFQPTQRTGPARPLKHCPPVGGLTAQPACTRSRGLSWRHPLLPDALGNLDLVRECVPSLSRETHILPGSRGFTSPGRAWLYSHRQPPTWRSDRLPPTTQLCSPSPPRPLPLQIILYDE